MKTNQRIKEVTVSLAIQKAGGPYQFWRKLAKAAGATDFKLRRGNDDNFHETAVGRKTFIGQWDGGKKPWSHKDNPSGMGFLGTRFMVGKDKSGTIASTALLRS